MTVQRNRPRFDASSSDLERHYSKKYRVGLARAMRNTLENLELSQSELARRAEWKESYVSRLLAGETNITMKTVARFETAVGIDVLIVPAVNRQSFGELIWGDDSEMRYVPFSTKNEDIELESPILEKTGEGMVSNTSWLEPASIEDPVTA